MPENKIFEKLRFFTLLLFISGSFNILLLAFLFYFAFKERPPAAYCELKPIVKATQEVTLNSSLAGQIRELKALRADQLFEKLLSTKELDSKISERDLALAVLTDFHDFDLKKALTGFGFPQKQRALMCNGERILIYPDLNEQQFSAIIDFTNREKWPFKTKGLFYLLKNNTHSKDPSLIQAFTQSNEFQNVKILFARSSIPIDNHAILTFLLEGDWALLSAFCERQKKACDLSSENRAKLLLEYIKAGSKSAVYLFLKTDLEFAVNRLGDETVILLLGRLEEKTEESMRFVTLVSKAPRGDRVRQLAEKRLLEYFGPKFAIQEKVLTGLKAKEASPIINPVKKRNLDKKEQIYIIQEGDSLWKIAKKFNLNVDTLRCYNRLPTDLLQPGDVLKIPS